MAQPANGNTQWLCQRNESNIAGQLMWLINVTYTMAAMAEKRISVAH